MLDNSELLIGKMRETSIENTMIHRHMTSALILFSLSHQIGTPFSDEKDVSDFVHHCEDLTIDWLNGL